MIVLFVNDIYIMGASHRRSAVRARFFICSYFISFVGSRCLHDSFQRSLFKLRMPCMADLNNSFSFLFFFSPQLNIILITW